MYPETLISGYRLMRRMEASVLTAEWDSGSRSCGEEALAEIEADVLEALMLNGTCGDGQLPTADGTAG